MTILLKQRTKTWEVNPHFEKGHPLWTPEAEEFVLIEDLNIAVPKEFEEEFLSDGVDAMTRIMAPPPLTQGGFFENPHTINEAVDKGLPRVVVSVGERQEIIAHAVDNPIRRYVTLPLDSLPPKVEGRPYYIHCDPGLKKDAFTLAVCHTTEDYRTIETAKGEREQLQRVVVDFVIAWEPRFPRVVDYLNVRAVLKQLVQFYDVKRVTFDRWNSVEGIQELVAMGVDADDMSFSNAEQLAMYRYLRLAFYNDMITLAPGDEKTQLELKFIKQKGHEIVHDLYGKDWADAVASVVWNAAGRAEDPAHRHSPRAAGRGQVRTRRVPAGG